MCYTIVMICIICDKPFEIKRNKNQKCCSRSCNATHHNKILGAKFIPPKCKQCGTPTRRESRAVFCSVKCQQESVVGEGNPMWKGGVKKHSEGYVYVYMPEHPNCDTSGYMLEHRVIMERIIGRFLFRKEVVHHVNGDKSDNRESNLELLNSQAEHLKEHNFFNEERQSSINRKNSGKTQNGQS